MADPKHPIWRLAAVALICVMIYAVNRSLAEDFSRDDWMRIINQIFGVLFIEGGVNAAKTIFGKKE